MMPLSQQLFVGHTACKKTRVCAGQLTSRARAFLVVACIRHLVLGYFCLLAADSFHSKAIVPVTQLATLQMWGVAFVALGVGLLASAILCHETVARIMMLGSIAITLYWGVCLVIAGYLGYLSSPLAPILMLSLSAKDMVIVSGPMRAISVPLDH